MREIKQRDITLVVGIKVLASACMSHWVFSYCIAVV